MSAIEDAADALRRQEIALQDLELEAGLEEDDRGVGFSTLEERLRELERRGFGVDADPIDRLDMTHNLTVAERALLAQHGVESAEVGAQLSAALEETNRELDREMRDLVKRYRARLEARIAEIIKTRVAA